MTQIEVLYRFERYLRTLRPIALHRESLRVAGHDARAQNQPILASLIETCKLSGTELHGYLTRVLSAIAHGHKQRKTEELLPWRPLNTN